MATLHTSALRAIAKGKRKADHMGVDEPASDEPKRKRNKQRVLLLSSRGVTHRMRHLMNDLGALLPHVKKGMHCSRCFSSLSPLSCSLADSKLDSKTHLHLLPELADLHNCNNALYFEARRHEDLYLWAAKTPNGPSIKMHVQNVHTMDELKMTGNCLRGSRGILSFDSAFDGDEHWKLMKEVFTHASVPCQQNSDQILTITQIFGVPPGARRAKPFIDHILTFSVVDNKIWFRNFQVGHVTLLN